MVAPHMFPGAAPLISSIYGRLRLNLFIIPGITYDISNKHRLGYSEVELVQKMIDGVNTLWAEDKELAAKHGL